eukprot:710786-Hanusia_phi.AAC.4
MRTSTKKTRRRKGRREMRFVCAAVNQSPCLAHKPQVESESRIAMLRKRKRGDEEEPQTSAQHDNGAVFMFSVLDLTLLALMCTGASLVVQALYFRMMVGMMSSCQEKKGFNLFEGLEHMIEGSVFNDTATVIFFVLSFHRNVIATQASGKNKETVEEKRKEKEKEER